jgi:glycosyltransferase involved in cell wall biosynthesis
MGHPEEPSIAEPRIVEPRVVALIPAYNESARVAKVVRGVAAYLAPWVIDDGSRDDTAAAAEAAGATVLRQWPNQGKGAALRLGFQHALADGCDAVMTLDADGQHDPAEIPKFLEAFAARRADLIIGQRRLRRMPPIRRLANWLGRKTFSWAVGQPVPDSQSGYRLLSRQLMVALESAGETGFEFELEMIVICVRQGFTLDWVPIRTIYAGESSHIDSTTHLSNFLRVVAQTRRTR